MVTQQNIIDAVKTLLLADSSLTAYIDDRIFEVQPPVKAFFPYLVIYPITDDLFDYMGDSNSDFSMLLQIDIVSKFKIAHGSTEARAINEIIFALLRCTDITITGGNGCQSMTDRRGTEIIENQSVLIQSDYRVFGTID